MNRRAFHRAVIGGGIGSVLASAAAPFAFASPDHDGVLLMVEQVLDGLPHSPIAFAISDDTVNLQGLRDLVSRLRGDSLLTDVEAPPGPETILSINKQSVSAIYFDPAGPRTIWQYIIRSNKGFWKMTCVGDGRPHRFSVQGANW